MNSCFLRDQRETPAHEILTYITAHEKYITFKQALRAGLPSCVAFFGCSSSCQMGSLKPWSLTEGFSRMTFFTNPNCVFISFRVSQLTKIFFLRQSVLGHPGVNFGTLLPQRLQCLQVLGLQDCATIHDFSRPLSRSVGGRLYQAWVLSSFNLFYIFLYFGLHVYLCITCMAGAHAAQKNALCRCWGLNLGPREEQPFLSSPWKPVLG